MVAPQGKRKLEQFLAVLMDERGGAGLSPGMVVLVEDARAQWGELVRRIAAFDALSSFALGEGERRGQSADDDPWLRPDYRIGARCRCRSSGKFRPRSRSRRMAGLGSQAVHYRGQAEAAPESASAATSICANN